jgi:hypothetical protein
MYRISDASGLWLAILAVLGPALLGCTESVSPDSVPLASAHSRAELRIASMVRDWFAALEVGAFEPRSLDDFPADLSFEFTGAEGSVLSRSEFRARLSDLRSTYAQIEHRVDEIRVEPAGEGLYRARFEFERRALDEAGTPHIARREHTWLVQDEPDEPMLILRIDERPMLPFPGTGPRIVCY